MQSEYNISVCMISCSASKQGNWNNRQKKSWLEVRYIAMPNGEEQCYFCMKEQLKAKKSITREPMVRKLPKA